MPTSTCIIVGLVVGLLASTSFIRSSHGRVIDLGLGIAGAVSGGLILYASDARQAAGLDVLAVVASVAGAGTMLAAFHAFFPRAPGP